MRLAAASLTLLLSTPAYAGGVGLLLQGGLHTETVHYYSDHTEDGTPYEDIDDYDQYSVTERLPNYGGGLELILGDRDDRITGSFRFYYQQDAPQTDPAAADTENSIDSDYIVAVYREDPRHLGMGMIGLNWGILGDPANFQFGASGHVGSGFLTLDHTEFLAWDVGPSVSYRVARQMVVFGDVLYQGRFHKGFSHGANAFAGVRYLFD